MKSHTLFRIFTIAIALVVLFTFGVNVHAQDITAGDMTAATIQLQIEIDTLWILIAGFMVILMQSGFALLSTGFIRHTGVVNTMMTHLSNAAVTGLVFWAVGYGIAFGATVDGFFGTSNFFLGDAVMFDNGMVVYQTEGGISVLALFFFHFAFAATASAIVTGAMAERTNFIGKLIYSAAIGAIIYPVAVHWVWGDGWLANSGFLDFAGGMTVHATGGIIAFIGAAFVGARRGRIFGSPLPPSNLTLATLGTLILWFGWYGLTTGSVLGLSDLGLLGLVAVNTTLSAAAGAATTLIIMYALTQKWDLPFCLRGALAGLVGITAGAAYVAPWAAVIIGLASGVAVVVVTYLVEISRIDDAAGVFAVHGACGLLGAFMLGLLGQPELGAAGFLLTGRLGFISAQVEGIAAITLWVATTSSAVFALLSFSHLLRISTEAEERGIDMYEHGTSLWPDIMPLDDHPLPEGATGD